MPHYQIKIRGRLPADISLRFQGFEVTDENDRDTFISGPVADQSELHGILAWLRDFNLDLLSVQCVERVPGKENDA